MADVVDPQEGADNPDGVDLDWIPENFRRDSLEDSLRAALDSQKEAQRKITELSSEKRGIEEAFGEVSAQIEALTAARNQPDPQDVEAQWLTAYEQNPIWTMQELARQTAEQVHSQYAQQSQQQQGQVAPEVTAFIADQNMTQAHHDWQEYKTQVAELVQQDPLFANDSLWSNPATATQALDRAYKMVKADSVLSGNDVAQQQLADTRQMKLNAQSASGAAGRPESPDASEKRWEEIMGAKTGGLQF